VPGNPWTAGPENPLLPGTAYPHGPGSAKTGLSRRRSRIRVPAEETGQMLTKKATKSDTILTQIQREQGRSPVKAA
jgi:hypothetical protein